jgi:hypothetical protein
MGLFDRDVNFGETFRPGDRFILTSLTYEGEIDTVHGKAQKSRAGIVIRGDDESPEKYSLLGSGFAEQARNAERGDFPCVVEYVLIPLAGDREVKRLVPVDVTPRNWFEGDDGPPVTLHEGIPAASNEDIPF